MPEMRNMVTSIARNTAKCPDFDDAGVVAAAADVVCLANETRGVTEGVGAVKLQVKDDVLLVSSSKSYNIHLTYTDDVTTVKICGALKSILSVAAGVVDGLRLGANTKSTIIRLDTAKCPDFDDAGVVAAAADVVCLANETRGVTEIVGAVKLHVKDDVLFSSFIEYSKLSNLYPNFAAGICGVHNTVMAEQKISLLSAKLENAVVSAETIQPAANQ
nr:glycerol 3 phosphate dehydrogenase 1 [Hymenolepis microstoma]